jgi:hypothetical protein
MQVKLNLNLVMFWPEWRFIRISSRAEELMYFISYTWTLESNFTVSLPKLSMAVMFAIIGEFSFQNFSAS